MSSITGWAGPELRQEPVPAGWASPPSGLGVKRAGGSKSLAVLHEQQPGRVAYRWSSTGAWTCGQGIMEPLPAELRTRRPLSPALKQVS